MVTPTRELGTLDKPWRNHNVNKRNKWAAEGARELSSRLSKRLSITQKDARNIIRIIGQEATQMLVEGWVLSIPGLCILWTFTTRLAATALPGFKGQIFGGNKRIRMYQSPVLTKKFKELKREAATKSETE